MGEPYILAPTIVAGTTFLRVHDVTNALINAGRTYTFALPPSCQPQCGVPYTQVAYTIAQFRLPTNPSQSASCR